VSPVKLKSIIIHEIKEVDEQSESQTQNPTPAV
jgi:hypothetical protein